MAIDRFDGPYQFLSNFYPSPITVDGQDYPSVEHAYQAAKTLDPAKRQAIAAAPTAGKAKRLGQKAPLRSDWDLVRIDVMRKCLQAKFADPVLLEQLVATGNEVLIEGNHWGDHFWGVCNGKGDNWLGRLLMEIRAAATGSSHGRFGQ